MGRLAASAYRKKATHLIEGNRLWRDGKRDEAAEHFRKAAAIEDRIVGEMLADERGDWVVNAVSLLSCLRKAGEHKKEQRALDDFLGELRSERPLLDEQFAHYARKIKRWKVKP